MNKDSIKRRLRRDLDEVETAALEANTPLAQALGARDWGLGWRLDTGYGDCCIAAARWYGYVLLPGARLMTSDHYRSPEAAAEALGQAMLRRLMCPHCARPIATGLSVGCPWRRFGDHWRPGCLPNPPSALPIPAPAGKDETA